MKLYFNIFMILFSSIGFAQGPIESNPNLLEKVNLYRMKENSIPFQENAKLTKALNIITEKKWGEALLNNKDSLRIILNSFKNYDYQVDLLKIKVPTSKSVDVKKLIEENVDFSKIIKDSCYNKFSYILTQEKDNKFLLVLASQGYIDFDDNLLFESRFAEGGGSKDFITLSGKSLVDTIFYQLQDQVSLPKSSMLSTAKKLYIKDDGKFSVKIDINELNNNKLNYITFGDKSGKMISIFKLREND